MPKISFSLLKMKKAIELKVDLHKKKNKYSLETEKLKEYFYLGQLITVVKETQISKQKEKNFRIINIWKVGYILKKEKRLVLKVYSQCIIKVII